MVFPFDALPSMSDLHGALPALPHLAARALPILPLTFSTSVLAISTEWICHLSPLPHLERPITGGALSEIFRKSYTNGAWTFLFNIFASIGSGGYMYLALDPHRTAKGESGFGFGWFVRALTLNPGSPSHPLQTISSPGSSNLELRRSLYLLSSIFGILHLFPFGPVIFPHVLAASRPSSRPGSRRASPPSTPPGDHKRTARKSSGTTAGETEDQSEEEGEEVKRSLRMWLTVNRVRIWTDVAAAVCAFLALVV